MAGQIEESETKSEIGRTSPVDPASGLSLCAQCGTWRSKACGEGCTWGVEGDKVNGGFKVSETVLEWYYKDWRRIQRERLPAARCDHCDNGTESGWSYCAYCGNALALAVSQ